MLRRGEMYYIYGMLGKVKVVRILGTDVQDAGAGRDVEDVGEGIDNREDMDTGAGGDVQDAGEV